MWWLRYIGLIFDLAVLYVDDVQEGVFWTSLGMEEAIVVETSKSYINMILTLFT